ncbi:MAG: signal recognition particle-docking protein FtsY [Victivallaceae bacterium]
MFNFFRVKLKNIFGKKIDDSFLDRAEQLLYEADFGSGLVELIIEHLRHKTRKIDTEDKLFRELAEFLFGIIRTQDDSPLIENPEIYLMLGSNGSGKTTTIAKLANRFLKKNLSVLFVGADTFRAAATEQLEFWSKKLNCPIIKGAIGGDPAAVACDGIKTALVKRYDVVLIDTSGRLHSNYDLMQELNKIIRVCTKSLEGRPFKTLLTIDASLGNNATEQARFFHEAHPLTGLVLTKTDGSSKGGTVFNIYHTLKIPTLYIGNGEEISDLQTFHPETFINKLLISTP